MTTHPDPASVENQIETATRWLEGKRHSMEKLLRELVEISSWTYDKAGVDAASAVLRAAMPLPCHPVKSAVYGDQNLFYGSRPASDSGMILVGHMDTVFPKEKFSGYRSDGKTARGPGVLDMKGGLVVIAFALKALTELGILEKMPLTVMVVSDEEVGSPESAPILSQVAKGAQASLVFESGRIGDAIITRRKGAGSITALAHGRAAHAGNSHQEGFNAIWAMSRFIDRIQSFTDYPNGITVNVGKIQGGIGKNTVPDYAEAWIDIRYIKNADVEPLRSRILAAASECAISGTNIEIQWGTSRSPMEKTEASAKLCQDYAQCQRHYGLGDGESGLVGGGSDGATTSAVGVPSIDGLGPRGLGFHTLDEYVELESFVPKAQALVRYLLLHLN